MKFTSKHVKSISRVAVPNPLLKFILCFFIEMNEVKNLLQYDKYPNYPQFRPTSFVQDRRTPICAGVTRPA